MSKLEEALEKANKLRGPGHVDSVGNVDAARKAFPVKEAVPIKVNNKNLLTITQPHSPVGGV